MPVGKSSCKYRIENETMSIMDRVPEKPVSSKDIKIHWIPISMVKSSCPPIKVLARW